ARFRYDEITARLEAGGVRWEPVQTTAELVEDPQAHAAGCFVDVPDADTPGKVQRQVASPPTFYDGELPIAPSLGKPPAIGEHTHEVLHELGYSDEEVDGLARTGAIPTG